MPSPSQPAPITREQRPPTEELEVAGRPVLLAAFPKQVAVPLPTLDEKVGRAWIAGAGLPDDDMISSEHLQFRRVRGRLEIEDFSRNGSFVDGEKLAPQERTLLEDGAVLRLGSTLLVYREAYAGPEQPQLPLGRLAAPWGLVQLRAVVASLGSRSPRNVLIQGDTGTGKEHLAAEIARVLHRAGDLYGTVNLAGIPQDRLEAELFGWERGAFTGGAQRFEGLVRGCDKGAIFLDEIGELPMALQPKLLRLLENHEVQPLGAQRAQPVDVVILAATNRKLEERVNEGHFRADLLARFPVRLFLPPFDERPEDLYAMASALFKMHNPSRDLGSVPVRVDAMERMMLHDWPGNGRDLDRLMQSIDPDVGLKLPLLRSVLGLTTSAKAPPMTRQSVTAALEKCGWNQSAAARVLGVSRPRLRRAMRAHSIKRSGPG
jgi:hypothetical protein